MTREQHVAMAELQFQLIKEKYGEEAAGNANYGAGVTEDGYGTKVRGIAWVETVVQADGSFKTTWCALSSGQPLEGEKEIITPESEWKPFAEKEELIHVDLREIWGGE